MSLDLVLEDVDTDDVAVAEPVFVQLMITGTARTTDPEDVATALEGIEDAAKIALIDVEMVADVDGEDFDGELESNPRAQFAAKIMTAEMVRQDAIDDAKRVPMTPEQQADWDKNENDTRMRRSTDMYSQRLATTAKAFQAAEKWAAREDLSVAERCHGVAWQMRNDSNDTRGYDGDLKPTVMHPGNEYIDYYDVANAGDIQLGMARSALGLFT